ncbi:MAG: TIGR03808 family TAT-translocated repetitive protein [Rhizobiaceae bacterium]
MDRRAFLRFGTGLGLAGLSTPAIAADGLSGISMAALRGSIDATELGVRPDAYDRQSKAFNKMLQTAAERSLPVHLPAGTYVVSNLKLPRHVRLSGVPGATRIVYGGDGHLFAGEELELFDISGLHIDGANHWLADYTQGLIDLRRARQVAIDNCEITGSGKNAVALERAGGRIERSQISGAADAAIYSVEGLRLEIAGNRISDCANGGILVHRWQAADDGAIITGNRIDRISARNGGTGQFGNGINVFRANNVIISGNIVADCAFSAIRANSAGNVQVSGNNCSRSGETAIYAEFAFDGAVIASNIIDGAANGISIVNFNNGGRLGVCSGNLVRNLSAEGPYAADAPGFGVGISVEADTSVTGNVVEGAPLYGIHIGWGAFMRNVVTSGNVVRKAGEGIAVSVVDGTGTAVISDNVIEATRHGAIFGHRWTERVTGDLAKTGADAFPLLTVERNLAS